MAKSNGSNGPQHRRLRSQLWFDNPDDPGMTAVYLERYLNFGLTLAELTSGRPIIGIAQSGSDLSPCNRHHLDLAHRVRAGIRDAGGIPLEFRPTRFRKPASGRQRRSIATSPTSVSLKCCSVTRSTASC